MCSVVDAKNCVVAMSTDAARSQDVPCSQKTQATITTSAIGVQCALTRLISASSQTEEKLPVLEVHNTQAGASEKFPASQDGADFAAKAGPHICSFNPPSGDTGSRTARKSKLFERSYSEDSEEIKFGRKLRSCLYFQQRNRPPTYGEVCAESESEDDSSEEDSSSSDDELRSTSSTSDLSAAATSRKRARCDNAQWDTESEWEDGFSSEEDSSSWDDELHSSSWTSDLSAAATSRKRARCDNAQWDTGGFSPSLFTFDDSQSGQVAASLLPPEASEFDYFKLFFDEELLSLIVTETNKYGSEKAGACHFGASRLRAWVAMDLPELYCFLAIVLLMGLVQKNSLRDYWSTDPMLMTPFFRDVFSVNRFVLLLRVLHFSSKTEESDCLSAIRPVMEAIQEKFSRLFLPYQDLCIDDSLMPWRGHLSFRQYIPSKRHRFGVKMFMMCDVKTGYVLRFLIYTGATVSLPKRKELGYAGSVVAHLLADFLGKGHSLFVDSRYTSPVLFEFLHSNRTNACGTVRFNRKGLPSFKKKMKKNEIESFHTNTLLALKWCDKREVTMLTSMHGPQMQYCGKVDRVTGEKKKKPACVLEYTKKMGLVDRVDMELSFSESTRKTLKWNKKFFFHLFDMVLLNAFILYRERTGTPAKLAVFRKRVATQILEQYKTQIQRPRRGKRTTDSPLRLTACHFPERVPETSGKGSRAQRRCHVCANTTRRPRKRTDTRFMCADCNKALCVDPCFKEYHTLKYY